MSVQIPVCRIGVYVFRAADGEVLYVGASANVFARIGSHMQRKTKWHLEIRSVEIIPCPDIDTCHLMELELIREFQPFWNIRHNPRRQISNRRMRAMSHERAA